MAENNIYNNLSSKIKRMYIALPGFEFFHEPSNINKEDPHFVGRERISETLKSFLRCDRSFKSIFDSNNSSGSYLITGYRGMGKSSFVGKVIKELIDEQRWTQVVSEKMSVAFLFICYFLMILPLLYFGCTTKFHFKPLSYNP